MAILEILDGPRAGSQKELDEQTLIGRHSACDIVLESADISRWHCRIVGDDDGCSIEDLGSLNGTFVNGERIHGRRPLNDGDEIQLCRVRLRFAAHERKSMPRRRGYAVRDSSAA